MSKITWNSFPKLEFILNKEELKDKFVQTPESPQEFITKKRKLTNYSENSTSLNESFSNLIVTNSSMESKCEIKIPQPIRYFRHSSRNHLAITETFCNEGINSFKNFAIEKKYPITSKNIGNLYSNKEKMPYFIYMPFGVPLNMIDYIMKPSEKKLEKEKYIGNLSLDERKEKIQKYLEKKKKRQWKTIRYNIRKDLADQRDRFQGKFVKSNKTSLVYSNIDGLNQENRNNSLKTL